VGKKNHGSYKPKAASRNEKTLHKQRSTDTAHGTQTHSSEANTRERLADLGKQHKYELEKPAGPHRRDLPNSRNQLAIGADLETIKLQGQNQIWAYHIRGTAAARPHQSTHKTNCHIRHSAAIHSQHSSKTIAKKNHDIST